MWNFEDISKYSEETKEKLKEAIKELQSRLFIFKFSKKDKDRKLYNFMAKDENSKFLSSYFDMSGYKFVVDNDKNVIYIKNIDGKGYNFNKNESIVFLYLLLTYYEKRTSDIEHVGSYDTIHIVVDDIYTLLTDFNHKIKFTELREILFKFKSFNLIDIEVAKDRLSINDKISIYPSITCIIRQSDITNIQNQLSELCKGE